MISAKTEDGYLIEIPPSFDDYDIVKYEGNGCSSVVFKVRKKWSNNYYAAKIISKTDMMNKNYLEDINNEITIHKMLSHPNILNHLRTFELKNSKNEEFVIIIEEYCSRGNLLTYINTKGFKNKQERIKIEKGIINGVQYLHRLGYAHNDIRLENILLDKNLNVKLSDFGLCEYYPDDNNIGFKADIWSIGMILFTLYEGRLIKKTRYVNKHLLTRIEDLKLKILVDKCTILDWEKRPDINTISNDEYFSFKEEEKKDEINTIFSEEGNDYTYPFFSDFYTEVSINFESSIDMKKSKISKKNFKLSKTKLVSKIRQNKINQKYQSKTEKEDNDNFVFVWKEKRE